jgi:polysaccharide biosynthesis protein PslH
MKITLVCHEIPYPPIHGGRIDMWRRIKAFAAQGVELQAIFWWFGTEPTAEELAEIQKYVQKVHPIKIERTWISRMRRILDLWLYPLEVTSRIIRGQNLNTLMAEVQTFSPDVIFLDGIHGGVIASTLSQRLNVPMVTRSHNIEHLYYHRMLESAVGLKNKFKRHLSVIHLEKYEKYLLKNSAIFYDISADDLKFWQNQGFTNGHFLPPLMDLENQNRKEALDDNSNEINKVYDIVFLGNLSLENNIAGVVWFVTEVLPIVQRELPGVTMLVAGLNPVNKVRQICEKNEGIFLIANPASASAIYKSGRVLINPILTGSGVKIKSVEMLSFEKPIVSTSEGISGLPEAVKKYFRIADDAQLFGLEVIKALLNKNNLLIDYQLLESLFGQKVIENVISDIKRLL